MTGQPVVIKLEVDVRVMGGSPSEDPQEPKIGNLVLEGFGVFEVEVLSKALLRVKNPNQDLYDWFEACLDDFWGCGPHQKPRMGTLELDGEIFTLRGILAVGKEEDSVLLEVQFWLDGEEDPCVSAGGVD